MHTTPCDRRPIIGVLVTMAVGWTGSRLLTIALPWFVLSSTGSAVATGIVAFAQMGPYVVAQLLSGPLIDKVGARKVSILGDGAAGVALALIPVLYLITSPPLAVLMLIVAVVGVTDGPANVAKSVMIPAATRAAGMRLEQSTGLSGAIERTASTAGPAIAGVVVAAFGGIDALWITAGLTALGGIIMMLFVPELPLEKDFTEDDAGYLKRLRTGAGFLRRDGLLRSITGMVMATNLLDQAFMVVLLPVWAKAHGYGPETVGLIVSVFSAASIVASLAAAAWGHRLPRRLVYLLGFLIGGVPRFAILALGAPMWSVLAICVIGGMGSGFINPIIGAVQYERVPDHLMGRVTTLIRSLAWSGIPFGGLLGSAAIAAAGLSGALLAIGGLYFLAILLPGLRPEWAEMDRDRAAEAPAEDKAVTRN